MMEENIENVNNSEVSNNEKSEVISPSVNDSEKSKDESNIIEDFDWDNFENEQSYSDDEKQKLEELYSETLASLNSSDVKGKDAYTKITLLKLFKSYSYVEIEIETGRTHQIRAHAASIGHPVVGDNKYGGKISKTQNKLIKLHRIFLHSYYLSFYYNKEYEFVLDLPYELKEVLSILENENE